MSKVKTVFFCQNCGAQASKWIGKCPSCNEWNTYAEEIVHKTEHKSANSGRQAIEKAMPVAISEIKIGEESRIEVNDNELSRVLGGGIVPGSLVLIGGEPGIGKSTLLLQLALNLKKQRILYISGEESLQQIKMRAERIAKGHDNCIILTETNSSLIFSAIESVKPTVVIIDSIQTLFNPDIESSPGSVSQVRECTAAFMRFAKESNIPIFLIGHINKEGSIAGPKVLEHIVDTVIMFEGDRNHAYRVIRAVKNRFGSTSELGIYQMNSNGMREVSNPSEILLSQRDESLSGIAISATIEGMRPLLIETQALVCASHYGTPQRSATGYDLRRMNMLLAVLEKKCGFKMGAKDVFLNITGGIKVDDPAVDLGVVAALLSSYEDKPISSKICFAAEVGLSGEIRPVARIEQRVSEADKLGFERIYISSYNKKGTDFSKLKIDIRYVGKIEQVYNSLFD